MSRRLCLVLLAALPAPALAHPAQGGFVLLLPTKVYIAAGCAAVSLSVLIVALMPAGTLARLFAPRDLGAAPDLARAQGATRVLAAGLVAGLVWIGLAGPRDPATNLLPLTVWTLWWIGLFTVQGVAGDLWAWVNPWRGMHDLVRGDAPAPFRLPQALGHAPAIAGLLAVMWFTLADPAPDDPARLAWAVLGYTALTLAGMALFGAEAWLGRAECFTVLLRLFARLAPAQTRPRLALGLPGWAAMPERVPLSLGAFVVVLLAAGSFDGLNKTFFFLGLIGVNPLEFPGRSAVLWPMTLGLLGAALALLAAFAACVAAGHLALRGPVPPLRLALGRLAMSLLPIAFAYHVAHFLTTWLVNGQYALAAMTDPLHTGADLLGLGQFYVTTGFFNTRATVRAIWLTQAGIIVIGHVLGVLMAHRMAIQLYGGHRRAVLAQAPLAAFMVLYTLLGLWLLAAPRGA